jgi:hypothetical protein
MMAPQFDADTGSDVVVHACRLAQPLSARVERSRPPLCAGLSGFAEAAGDLDTDFLLNRDQVEAELCQHIAGRTADV